DARGLGVVQPSGRWDEHTTSERTSGRPATVQTRPRGRVTRPGDDARRRRLGIPSALPGDVVAPARAGLLVARDRAAAPRRPGGNRLCVPRRAQRDRGSRNLRGRPVVQPPAEFVHWMFATGLVLVGLCLAAQAIVGDEVWRRRAWRAYLWPGLAFTMGVLMFPVMVFFTNSTIHMLAHGSWAQVMMLSGAAELGLVRGKLHSR